MTDKSIGGQHASLETNHNDNGLEEKPKDKASNKIDGDPKADTSEQKIGAECVSKMEHGKGSGVKSSKYKSVSHLASDHRDEQHQERREPIGTETHSRTSPSPFKTSKLSLQSSSTEDRATVMVKSPINVNVKAEEFDWENTGPKELPNDEEATLFKSNMSPKGAMNIHPDDQMTTEDIRENNRPCAEDSSFPLFNNSFDSMSENGHYLQGHHHHLKENDEFSLSSPTCSLQGGVLTPKIDIALPNLGHEHCSLGDISPIKFIQQQAAEAEVNRTSQYESKGQYLPLNPAQVTHYQQGQQHSADSKEPPRQDLNYQQPPPHHHPHQLQLQHQHQPRGISVTGTYDYLYSQDSYITDGQPHISNPYFVIRSCQQAFVGFVHVLPCLRETVSVNLVGGHIRHRQSPPKSMDLTIATRRIATAICVFGGSPRPLQTSSIFRLRGDGSSKQKYDRCMSQRYHLTDGRISWEVEENPPVSPVESERSRYDNKNSATGRSNRSSTNGNSGTTGTPHVIVNDNSKRSGRTDSGVTTSSSSLETGDANKMKYRCKLCGQPKQKHNCPYSQSLQRNIGVMVHSAVNAYTAAEPGSLAPALSKMNNFVSYDSGNSGGPEEVPHPTNPIPRPHHAPPCQTSTVTPQTQTAHEGGMICSPQSSLSTHSQEMSPHGEANCEGVEGRSNARKRTQAQMAKQGQETKSFHPKPAHFAPSVQLRPEHYRAVTRKTEDSVTAYQYTPVPVTFTERKRLSDTLFFLSREIPSMTSQCALVLREAREKDDWDQAVAELLTQVVVGLYCGEDDSQLDGLQQYLLALGVSC